MKVAFRESGDRFPKSKVRALHSSLFTLYPSVCERYSLKKLIIDLPKLLPTCFAKFHDFGKKTMNAKMIAGTSTDWVVSEL